MSRRTTLLLNWYANPYHAPIIVSKTLGYYSDAEINLALLEPSDPSDVTEIVGGGRVDIGLKAMIHTIAARAQRFPVVSIGTLIDEPITGLISLKSAEINKFSDIQGKRVGYVGHFGKRIIDNLAEHAGIDQNSYTAIRVGMNVVDAILDRRVDTGIGFGNFQQIELATRSNQETSMLRIDQLAGLGCCCFCSIQFIMNQQALEADVGMAQRFLLATRRGVDFVIQNPERAFELLGEEFPRLRGDMHKKIFVHMLPFFSRTLLNVERDWQKVFKYTKHLGLTPDGFRMEDCYSNEYVPEEPYSDIKPLACCVT